LKLNLEQLRANKPELIKSVKQHGIESISYFCACTGLPVIAACFFVKEDLPEFTEEMDRKIKALTEFYGYKF
jgi:hypothetical protein